LIPVLNTFKITTFPHLEYIGNMTEYSFYNCSIDTAIQRQDEAYAPTSEWSAGRMPIVLLMHK